MTRFFKIFTFLTLTFLLSNCKDNNKIINPLESKTNENYSSFQFNDSIENNIYFNNQKLNKQIQVNDILVDHYRYDPSDNSAFIFGTPYDKNENRLIVLNPNIYDFEKKPYLNGKLMNKFVNIHGHYYRIYLKNPKSLNKLKMFNIKEEFIHTKSDTKSIFYTDLISISANYTGIEEDAYIVLENAEILHN